MKLSQQPREIKKGGVKMNRFRSDYETYFVEYYGDIKNKMEMLDYAFLYEELPIYYVVLIEEGRVNDFLKDIPGIISIQQNYIYVLSKIEEKDYSLEDKCINLESQYNGKGITVGVIGGEIDYLDKEFINEDGECRIKAIWDQTIDGEKTRDNFYGKVYHKSDIEEAIQLHRLGDNPYKKVEHIHGGGYGTTICKAIGGSKYNSVNQCEFAIVNLKTAEGISRKMNCIKFRNGNLYEAYDVVKALQYFAELNKDIKGPMVVYLPVESNSGGRNGSSVLERYINYLSNINNDFFVITNNGSEGDGYRHSYGEVKNEAVVYVPIVVGKEINENIDEMRYDFQVSLWTNIHDKIDFKVISPLGEQSQGLETSSPLKFVNFDFNGGNIEIVFMAPGLKSNEREILIKCKNSVQGTWMVGLEGKEVVYGDYDMWLPMKELTNYNVNFRYPCKHSTLTTPSTSSKVISSMCYSQYENDIRILSGRPCRDVKKRTQESFGVDSTGLLIEDEYGILKIYGVAVAGCILCWMVVLILQWSVIEGNKPNIDFKEIKLLLSKASTRHLSNCHNIVDINKLNDLLVEL